mmetsp:Transcript_23658/g.26233  ORF Transcript_23658/g.26233 Transcript_23658/m.26233 type:complete len:239 (-) Transcript_23658:632-1348(-)
MSWSAKTPTTSGVFTFNIASHFLAHSVYQASAFVSLAEDFSNVGVLLCFAVIPTSDRVCIRLVISFASSTDTRRFDFEAKTRPMKSAPASTVARASSTFLIPHILTYVIGTPFSSFILFIGLGERINASPTSTARAPTFSNNSTSERLEIPLSAHIVFSFMSTPLVTRSVVPLSTVNVCKFLLLTPITLAPTLRAIFISDSFATSTSGSMPSSLDVLRYETKSASSRDATIRRSVSAP